MWSQERFAVHVAPLHLVPPGARVTVSFKNDRNVPSLSGDDVFWCCFGAVLRRILVSS